MAQFTYGMLALGQQLHALGIAGQLALQCAAVWESPAACVLPVRSNPGAAQLQLPCWVPLELGSLCCPFVQRVRGWTPAAAWRAISWMAMNKWGIPWPCSMVRSLKLRPAGALQPERAAAQLWTAVCPPWLELAPLVRPAYPAPSQPCAPPLPTQPSHPRRRQRGTCHLLPAPARRLGGGHTEPRPADQCAPLLQRHDHGCGEAGGAGWGMGRVGWGACA